MPRRKPAGWPDHMVAKRLADGATGYYWQAPPWARQSGYSIRSEALGRDYGEAKRRCDDILNPQLAAWRLKDSTPATKASHGTVDWMFGIYKATPRYTELPARTRKSYDAALRSVADHVMKDGRRFGAVQVRSVTPGAADKLFQKILRRDDGTERRRTAVLSMTVAKTAWNAARRDKPADIPSDNPFAGMRLPHKAKPTRPVTHDELVRFVAAADAAGRPSVGTAAMLGFYWLIRQVDILTRFSWGAYRTGTGGAFVKVWHHKTGAEVDLPLFDADGSSLWPELTKRLDAAPRHGPLIVMRDGADKKGKTILPWKADNFRHVVAAIRQAAGIDPDVKFMGLRHGGNTEGATAGLSDAQLRALSGHKTSAALLVYARETAETRVEAARKRRDARTKKGEMSE